MSTPSHRTRRGPIPAAAWCLIIPVFWLGLLVAISGIEAPLKFQAPGITIPLGLGIGRLVFGALNAVELVLLICLWLAMRRTILPAGYARIYLGVVGAFVLKAAIIRPFLNARTNAVIAGTAEGGSIWHFIYIGADVALGILLILLVLKAVGQWVREVEG